MSKKKLTPGDRSKKKDEVSLVRSSAAEYLTFVAASGQGGVEAVYADENVWLSQKMMGVLYDVETHTVNYHLKKVFEDAELEADSVVRNFRITAADGKTYDTRHYNLSATFAEATADRAGLCRQENENAKPEPLLDARWWAAAKSTVMNASSRCPRMA